MARWAGDAPRGARRARGGFREADDGLLRAFGGEDRRGHARACALLEEGAVAKPVTMPQLGESVTEGTITRWLKSEGDEEEIDEPLAEVDTDKVNAELPSPVAVQDEQFLVVQRSPVAWGAEAVLGAAR